MSADGDEIGKSTEDSEGSFDDKSGEEGAEEEHVCAYWIAGFTARPPDNYRVD